jgi:predicted sulfurtransferase
MRFIFSVLAVAIFALGVLTACNSAEWRNLKTSQAAPATAPTPADGARRVTVAELKDLLERNEAVVIDVRNEASYDAGHIRGAKLIPESDLVKRLDEIPRNKTIITYCS